MLRILLGRGIKHDRGTKEWTLKIKDKIHQKCEKNMLRALRRDPKENRKRLE